MNRRLFLGGLLAAAASPAIVRASSLMPIVAPKVWVPPDPFGQRGFVAAKFWTRAATVNGDFICFIHPDSATELRDSLEAIRVCTQRLAEAAT